MICSHIFLWVARFLPSLYHIMIKGLVIMSHIHYNTGYEGETVK